MIYIYAIFLACGGMHLVRFLWENYTVLVLGEDVVSMIASVDGVSFLWTGSYLLFAGMAATFAAVPAAKTRDVSLALISGTLFGAAVGLMFAGIMWARGEISYVVEFAQIALIPVCLSLMATMAGYIGAMLSRLDEPATDMNIRARRADNDNAPAGSTALTLRDVA